MRSRLMVVALVTAVGLLSSGCFVMRGFSFSKATVKVGEKNVLTVRLQAPTKDERPADYPFILIGFLNAGEDDLPNLTVANPRKFDTSRQLFNKPKALQLDTPLRDFISSSGVCEGSGVVQDDTTMTWFAYRTPSALKDKGLIGKVVLAKLGIKSKATANAAFETVSVVVGSWLDEDKDQVAESGEVICMSRAETSLTIRGIPAAARMSNDEILQRLERRYGR